MSAPHVRALQELLLASVEQYFLFGDTTLSDPVKSAFFAVPRHRFIRRYTASKGGSWLEVDERNLVNHMPLLYRDDGLGIGVDATGETVTISRPAWVLYMLELLQVRPGHRVFEVGAGSGWNAALLGQLAGPSGQVQSFEIIPDVAEAARAAVAGIGLENVRVVSGDAAAGPLDQEPFDRVVFTAGSYDIPGWMHGRVRVGGLLLLALKFPGGGDYLVLFRRQPDHFEALASRACEVVWMRGRTHDPALDPITIDAFEPWPRLRDQVVARRPFAFGGRFRADLAHRTIGLRSFLALTEPRMKWFVEPTGWPHYFFGLYDEPSESLALARDEDLVSHGGEAATQALVHRIHEWVDRGMPSAETMRLRAFPRGMAPAATEHEVLVQRAATDFLWQLV